ncbi:MAG: nitrous oxide-stimulated promoter family protein [Chloroflexi bacterium]|nr:nitrous oxide-stimulated promoter family protein [Chloroflexota bacterium]
MTQDIDPGAGERRMKRERRTIEAMIALYCRRRHGTKGALCGDCQELLGYALQRLAHCPFAPQKPTCARCPVHCYRPEMRRRIVEVMRRTRKLMFLRHPILTFRHLLDALGGPTKRADRGSG